MPKRILRIPGKIPLHVCNRSAAQIKIFHSAADYVRFETCLKEMLEKFPLRLFAFCIMPNHWHLLIEGDSGQEVTRGLHWLSTTHAIRLRKDTGSIGKGAVYQNRFRAYPIQRNGAFYRVAHYIERNPVDASLCQQPEKWLWSSASPEKSTALTLANWPISKPSNWAKAIQNPLDDVILGQIHSHEILQRPYGDPEWVSSFQT